jgi:hypothetical protein
MNSQLAWPVATLSTQQAVAARKAAVEVRRKLNSVAASGGDSQSQADAEPSSDGRQRDPPPGDDEAFRNVFVSVHA